MCGEGVAPKIYNTFPHPCGSKLISDDCELVRHRESWDICHAEKITFQLRIYFFFSKGKKSLIKERRTKYKRQRANKADAFVHMEGVQYKSQVFYGEKGKEVQPAAQKGRRRKRQRKDKS